MNRIETAEIPGAKGKIKVIHEDGDTDDIINTLLEHDEKFKNKAFCQFAQQFSGGIPGLKRLWKFVRFRIKYKEDPFGKQYIQLPPALWKSGVGDCKSKTVFVNAVLRCLGIPFKTRFVSYGTTKITHVYTVALIDGKELPIDTVYTKFGAEAPYSYKRDYMTQIAVVSGTNPQQKVSYKGHFAALAEQCDKGEVQKYLTELEEKKAFIPKAEPIAFSKMDEGTAAAHIILRQLELLKVMDDKNEKMYAEAIKFTKELIYNTGKGFTVNNCIKGVVPDYLQGLAGAMAQKMRQTQPAINFNRGGIGAPYQSPPPLPILSYFDANGDFFLARGTDYNLNWNDLAYYSQYTMGAWYTQVILWMKAEFVLDSSGNTVPNTQLQPVSTYGANYTKIIVAGGGSNIGPSTALTTNQVKTNPLLNLAFYNQAYKTEFEDRIKAASGIFDIYLNKVFEEPKGIGNSFIYGYANDVVIGNTQLNTNMYPQAVAAKNIAHQQWISRCSMFSGLSSANVKAMGANSIIYTSGKQPTEMLGNLVQAYNPNIGIDPATITLIIGLILSAIGTAISQSKKAIDDGNIIEPAKIPSDWVPIGDGLEFVAADWDTNSAGGNGSGNSGGNATTGNGNNFNTILALGAAGLGLYFLTKND